MGRKIVVLLGHPGVGKGTQARAIVNHIGIPQISTGDMLREAIANKTTYGCEAKEKMDAGELVSDAIVNGIVAERIKRDDCKKGFILDGYPRNVSQAETFREQVKNGDHLCDLCGTKLIHRSDDREDLIRERFRTYREETYPLVEFYQKLGAYHQVDGMRPIEDVTEEILSIIHKKKVLTPVTNGGK